MPSAQLMNQVVMLDSTFAQSLKGRIPLERHAINASQANQPSAPLAVTFAHALFDNGVRVSNDPHVSRLVKEPRFRLPISEGIKYGLRTGDRIKVTINGNSITGKVKLDEKIAAGTLVIPLGFNEIPANELGLNLLNGTAVEIAKET